MIYLVTKLSPIWILAHGLYIQIIMMYIYDIIYLKKYIPAIINNT